MLRRERERLTKAAAATSTSASPYVCEKCRRPVAWDHFARLVGEGKDPICPIYHCGGKVVKMQKEIETNLKSLAPFVRALKQVNVDEIPTLRTKTMQDRVKDLEREQEEQEGVVIAPSILQMPRGESKYIVQIVASTPEERDGFFVPPELEMVLNNSSTPAAAPAQTIISSRRPKELPP